MFKYSLENWDGLLHFREMLPLKLGCYVKDFITGILKLPLFFTFNCNLFQFYFPYCSEWVYYFTFYIFCSFLYSFLKFLVYMSRGTPFDKYLISYSTSLYRNVKWWYKVRIFKNKFLHEEWYVFILKILKKIHLLYSWI